MSVQNPGQRTLAKPWCGRRRVRRPDGGSCYAPGCEDLEQYVNWVRGAPLQGTVVHFQLQKSRYRDNNKSPWHITFNSGMWGSLLKDFVLQIEPNELLEEGTVEAEQAELWAFRKYRPRTGPAVSSLLYG